MIVNSIPNRVNELSFALVEPINIMFHVSKMDSVWRMVFFAYPAL